MSKFKSYKGNDKYHFRIYRHGKNHPFIVAVVKEEKNGESIRISGYMFTHSIMRVLKRPNDYVKLSANPNPNDDADSYVCVRRVNNLDSSFFSKPYTSWHLSKKDEVLIDKLESKYKK